MFPIATETLPCLIASLRRRDHRGGRAGQPGICHGRPDSNSNPTAAASFRFLASRRVGNWTATRSGLILARARRGRFLQLKSLTDGSRSTPVNRHSDSPPAWLKCARSGSGAFYFTVAISSSKLEGQLPSSKGGAIYCALFFASWAFCWSSFSSAAFNGTSLTVSLSILPVKRYGGW